MNEQEQNLEFNEQKQDVRVIKLREMTELEKQYFQAAKDRHRQNLTKPQVVQGKVFKGKSFISKPEKIIFNDFDINIPMTQTIYLTNVSFSFNSFQLMPLNEKIKDFFDIIYVPSGRISAGMQVPIKITFTSQINQDIDDFFPIKAETGEIMIPLQCFCKKSIVKQLDPIIDFGKVIFGESKKALYKLVNEGALINTIIFKGKRGEDLQALDMSTSNNTSRNQSLEQSNINQISQSLKDQLCQIKFDKVQVIQGYSNLDIQFNYAPTEIGQFEIQFQVYMENFLNSPAMELVIRGECVDVPIQIEKPIYDFETIVLNKIYREKLVFYNKSQNTMKVQIIPLKETRNFLEFNPVLGYIQGQSSFEIWVKLNSDKEIFNNCQKYIKNDILELPLKLVSADQIMPVNFTIKAQLTNDVIKISPLRADFGNIYENSGCKLPLTLVNQSQLPQQILFNPLPQVEPYSIPISLLPKEKFEINLIFRGQEAQQYSGNLNLKIITGNITAKQIQIPYSCNVQKCPLNIYPLKVEFPALPVNEKKNVFLQLQNVTNKQLKFEFFSPQYEISGLQINPMVQVIEPQQKLQISLEYKSFFKKLTAQFFEQLKVLRKKEEMAYKEQQKDPQTQQKQEEIKQDQKQDTKKETKKDDKKMTKQQQEFMEAEKIRLQEEEQKKLKDEQDRLQELEQNFKGKDELLKMGGKFYEFHKDDEHDYSQIYNWLIPCNIKYSNQTAVQTIYIEVNTVTVNKSLTVDQYVIDFGEIAVGQRYTQQLIISNNSNQVMELKSDMLPLLGGFSILNSLRTLKPGKKQVLVINFEPMEQQKFQQTLRVQSQISEVSVQLEGKGVKPEVLIQPENGLLNMGSILIKEEIQKTYIIQNISNFPINFQLKSEKQGIKNLNGSKVFQFIPSQGYIQAQSQQEITVVFTPDRINEKYYEFISIDVPNQKQIKKLYIYGSCYPRQVYLKLHAPILSQVQVESFQKSIENPFDIVAINDEERIFNPVNNLIVLQFEKKMNENDDTVECHTRKLVLGNCKLIDPKNEKNGNFEIIMPKDDKFGYFSCDNLKSQINSGQELVVSFKFKPPQVDAFIANISALQGIGQWIEQKAELKLNGGFIRPNTQDMWTFDIILRAYVNQF